MNFKIFEFLRQKCWNLLFWVLILWVKKTLGKKIQIFPTFPVFHCLFLALKFKLVLQIVFNKNSKIRHLLYCGIFWFMSLQGFFFSFLEVEKIWLVGGLGFILGWFQYDDVFQMLHWGSRPLSSASLAKVHENQYWKDRDVIITEQ